VDEVDGLSNELWQSDQDGATTSTAAAATSATAAATASPSTVSNASQTFLSFAADDVAGRSTRLSISAS
jgi:hypothetical protein